jgi:hypothetical protein
MLSFSDFLSENYKNLIGPASIPQREKWADQAWEMLQKSYAPIGGIKGSGFENKEAMVKDIPFWKLYLKNDKVIAAVFYKDRGGRKSVAVATDGSDLGKKIIGNVFKSSLGVSYSEKSGPALATIMKSVPWDELQRFMMTPEQVEKTTGEKIVLVSKYGVEKLDAKDRFTYDKFPQLKPYFYMRDIGGSMHLKVSMGTPNLTIFSR